MQSTIIPPIVPKEPSYSRIISSHEQDTRLDKEFINKHPEIKTSESDYLIFNRILSAIFEADEHHPLDISKISSQLTLSSISFNEEDFEQEVNRLVKILVKKRKPNQLTSKQLQILTSHIQELFYNAEAIKTEHFLYFLELAQAAITKYRFLNNETYTNAKTTLANYFKKYKLTPTENLYRHVISFNAGLGSGSVIYGCTTAILMNPYTIAVSGGLSLVAFGLISTYFLKSYNSEDKDLQNELEEFDSTIASLAIEEARIRNECYKIINKTQHMINEAQLQNLDTAIQNNKFKSLFLPYEPGHANHKSIAEIDSYIKNKLETYNEDFSTADKVENIHKTEESSIYTRIFHSKHWGPVLSFFGATGTIFGVTKSILFLAGITAIAGSTMGIGLAILGTAIVISGLIAVQHWRFNKKSEGRKNELMDFRRNTIKDLKIHSDRLKIFKENLSQHAEKVDKYVRMSIVAHQNPILADKIGEQVHLAKEGHDTQLSQLTGNENVSQTGIYGRNSKHKRHHYNPANQKKFVYEADNTQYSARKKSY